MIAENSYLFVRCLTAGSKSLYCNCTIEIWLLLVKAEGTNSLYGHILNCSFVNKGALIPSPVKQAAVIFFVKKMTYKQCWENSWEHIQQEWMVSFVGL